MFDPEQFSNARKLQCFGNNQLALMITNLIIKLFREKLKLDLTLLVLREYALGHNPQPIGTNELCPMPRTQSHRSLLATQHEDRTNRRADC